MKAIELKIGNIIGLVHEYFGDMPAVVKSINECGDLCLRCLGETCTDEEYECTMNEVYPIPITEDILLKNGFQKCLHTSNRYDLYKEGVFVTLFTCTKGESWLLSVKTFPSSIEFHGAKYINEIQNAFQLITNKELLIVL